MAEAGEAVRKVIDKCQEQAVTLLRQYHEAFERITARLLEKESICGEEFMELLELPC